MCSTCVHALCAFKCVTLLVYWVCVLLHRSFDSDEEEEEAEDEAASAKEGEVKQVSSKKAVNPQVRKRLTRQERAEKATVAAKKKKARLMVEATARMDQGRG